MQSLMHILGMLGGIAMAIAVPLILVWQCGFERSDAMRFVMIISVVSIGCGFALCRHCLFAASGLLRRPEDDEGKKGPGTR